MPFLDELLHAIGAVWDRTHIFSFTKDSAPGVHPRFMRDLRPAPESGLTGGSLLELYAVLDETHPQPDATTKIRLDVLEEDWLLTGGLDDRVVSLLGTGAVAPETNAPTRQLTTQILDLPDGRDLAWFVEEYKRTITAFEDTLLVVKQTPDPLGGRPGTQRTHVLAWLRVEHNDIGAHSELYFVLDIAGAVRAASPVLEIEGAPPGVSVRLTGTLNDMTPVAGDEPLEDVPALLAGRRAVTGESGEFVVDARLAVGDHPLRFERPGIDPVELTVRVSADAAGLVTAAVRDAGGNQLVSGTTTAAATEQSVLALTIPNPVAVRVHKLRGTVVWPDSRPGDVPANYRGTPLAERRVYVLPLPAGTDIAAQRPKTSREWDNLARRAEVLRSTRPGRPAQRERTDFSGRFEVKYVDYTAGNRFLVWVSRFDPVDATDTTTESPDFIVRSFRQELIELFVPALTTWGEADLVQGLNRHLVDHEYNDLTGDCVPLALEALRVADLPAPNGRTLVRPLQTTRGGRTPSAATRTELETLAALTPDTGDNLGVPASRIVGTLAAANSSVQDGLELRVLPLVPLYESADAQGGAARRAASALATTSAATFADYADIGAAPAPVRPVTYELGAVRLAVDTARLTQAVDSGAGVWDAAQEPNDAAKKVKLLEATFVVRPQLGAAPRRLRVEEARWHIDALSLADAAFVQIQAANPTVASRALRGDVHPVLAAAAPLLPGLARRRVYLAPGHGLFPANGAQASDDPADWRSNRGGYAENAGEDEVDALLSSQLAAILRLNGATIETCREIYDFTTIGVSNPAAGNFAPVIANPDFPRRWQQNPVFHLGAAGDAAAAAFNAPAGNRNDDGLMVRAAHMRRLAVAPARIDLIFAQHTNAIALTGAPGAAAPPEGNAHGMLVEYLNVATTAGGEGNPLGLGLATRLHTRMGERLRTNMRGVWTMNNINAEAVRDLFDTYDHWVHNVGPALTRDRLDTEPAAPHPAWSHNPFPGTNTVAPFTNWLRIPVALAEHGFHDNRDDARLLRRSWFRRLAVEGSALGIDAQLQDAPAAVSAADVHAVLRRTFGDTAALRARPAAGVATPASIAADVRAVAEPAAAAPVTASLGAVATAALGAARAFTRQALVDQMRDAVRTVAGWQATDAASTLDLWVSRAITDGRALERPTEPPTRAEAGAFACFAVGLTPASLATAERQGVGAPAHPLVEAAAVERDRSAFFPRVEANLLALRLGALRPQDVHRVNDAYLADAAWARLDTPRGGGAYELDPGTPLTIVFRTAGVAWKTEHQTGTNGGIQDVEIRVDAGGSRTTLGCLARATRVAASATWVLDLPPATDPVAVTLELWARHRTAGLLLVGSKRVKVKVRAVAA